MAAFDDDTIREISKALRRHVERVPLERVINDLFEMRGDKRFRDRLEKLQQGSYFPPFLKPRKTAEKALVTVIQETSVGGVPTRRVDELVQAMDLSGTSKSHVSKLCKDIDERVNALSIARSRAKGRTCGWTRQACEEREPD